MFGSIVNYAVGAYFESHRHIYIYRPNKTLILIPLFCFTAEEEVDFVYMSKNPTRIAGTDKENGKYFGLAFALIGVVMLSISVVKFFKGRA